MFNFGPSPEMLQRILPMLQQRGMGVQAPSGPPVDMPMGPTPTFPSTGGGMPPPRQPQIIDTMPQMRTRPDMPTPNGPAQGIPFRGMADRMSTNRPGLWGKFNAISQALQPMAMQSLMGRGRNAQGQGY